MSDYKQLRRCDKQAFVKVHISQLPGAVYVNWHTQLCHDCVGDLQKRQWGGDPVAFTLEGLVCAPEVTCRSWVEWS